MDFGILDSLYDSLMSQMESATGVAMEKMEAATDGAMNKMGAATDNAMAKMEDSVGEKMEEMEDEYDSISREIASAGAAADAILEMFGSLLYDAIGLVAEKDSADSNRPESDVSEDSDHGTNDKVDSDNIIDVDYHVVSEEYIEWDSVD